MVESERGEEGVDLFSRFFRLLDPLTPFMAKIETEILSKSVFIPTVWKRYIDDIFSLWEISKPDIEAFIEQATSHHPTIKFTADISDSETVFLDRVIYKGNRFKEQSILDIKTHFKPTETFQLLEMESLRANA